MEYPILEHFTCDHLPASLQQISLPFCNLASDMAKMLPHNDETEMALRKLMEAKDCAVRSYLSDG